MNRPLRLFDKITSEARSPRESRANVVLINPYADVAYDKASNTVVAVPVPANYKPSKPSRDSKPIDYLLIVVLSVFVHTVAVEQFKRMEIAKEDLVEPVKPPPKVQISFTQPKPKPIVQPPAPKRVVQPPPPKPNVVPLKKPPKPKVKPKSTPKAVDPEPIKTPVKETKYEAPAELVRAAPPPPPPPPPQKPKVEEKITQPRGAAGYKNNPPPEYPEAAADRGWEGRVLMKVHVSADGQPTSVQVTKSSGHDVLDDEAVRTVKKWAFAPAKRGSTPIDGWVTVPITFNLQN